MANKQKALPCTPVSRPLNLNLNMLKFMNKETFSSLYLGCPRVLTGLPVAFQPFAKATKYFNIKVEKGANS